MNNLFSRTVGLLGWYQPGSVFDEAEYFEAPANDNNPRIFMRARNGEIYRRVITPGEMFIVCFQQNEAWEWAKDWGWATTSRLWLPRGCCRISEDEAAQPPVGWVCPPRREPLDFGGTVDQNAPCPPRLPRQRFDDSDPGDNTACENYRTPKWDWSSPW